ncbi:4-alpha-glucanotransferase [Bradyrhizobium sp. SYSU BS000235]|uniref:4-alpha-glucanotransferase n=1 Tax=Bradyrhizobium sp. SYSU BS000235 TaxID=3411332 RepID=UPI003C757DBA
MDVLSKAAQLGIETSFIDATGQHRTIDPSALQMLLEAVPDSPHRRLLPDAVICRHSRGCSSVAIAEAAPIKWQIADGRGAAIAEGTSHDQHVNLPPITEGVYCLRAVDANGSEEQTNLISAPERAFSGDFDRVWILAVQLYGVRSAQNWGIGDFTDLEALIVWAAQSGAAGIGLNPLHALFDDHPRDCSPYSPNSRLFLNSLYIDVNRLPELPQEFAAEHAALIEAARSAEFVDYQAVADLKMAALRQAFEIFKSRTTLRRKTSFEEFRRDGGALLSRFACFEVLRRKFSSPWWDWPDHCLSPNHDALNELRTGPDGLEVEFIEFVQWCADEQLKACRDLARRLNLPVGLYLDVAVGVKADGFDAWNEQIAISHRLSVGAPPDLLNTAGQDWGLAGFNASGLALRSYEPFRAVLRASMRYAGAIRLDHVLGLNRLYLVPSGYLPSQGAYVQMPFEALLAVAALESVHHRCVVVGEDLGTVPDGFRERLLDWGIWSYRVMMFERGYDGSFLPVDHYPQDSMVTFNTHDLPTFAGWRSGHDIDLKHALGLDPGETRDARAYATNMLARALNGAQHGEPGFYSALDYLARTKSRILGVEIEDLLGVIDQPNIPGTINEHPNWRRRLPVSLEEWSQFIDGERLSTAMKDRAITRKE